MSLKCLGLLLPLIPLIAAHPQPLNAQPELPKLNSWKIPNSITARPYRTSAVVRRGDPPFNKTTPWALPVPFGPGCEGWRDEDCAHNCHHHCCHCWTWEEPCCGNGMPDPGEDCDLGIWNGFPGSGCTIDCKFEDCHQCGRCGDGIIQPELGEECDEGDGKNGADGVLCTKDCKKIPPPCTTDCCGNGILNPGEECDDGPNNGAASSKCTKDCKWKEGCCPDTCNPIAGFNECDETTSCIWIPGAPGPSLKYMCACASGFRADFPVTDTNHQIRFPYTGLTDRVFVAPGTKCDVDCGVTKDCNHIPVQGDMCFKNDP
ncbi:hypothetical protein BCR34DRAFT_49222 [Clohesyomyces aquaticus]|uniref:Uncharacterized protein n=1 Tax=Clohesyomyces aquaticus TaxID=1231657 RepID=A0A1Y1Z509_9PLEO|nr:hypothetical protein BCR34DRAFT_49222 [Clohesyomyces aquaticus]